jgi:hypothetical protein
MLTVALSLIPCLVMLFYRYPLLLLSLFPIVNFIEICFEFQPGFVGGYLLLPMDPVYFFTISDLCLYALLRPRKIGSLLKENIFLTMFLAMVAFNVVLYTPVYGQSAIGEARKFYFVLLIPLLASISLKKPEDLRTFIRFVILGAAAVCAVTLAAAVTRGSIVRAINASAVL